VSLHVLYTFRIHDFELFKLFVNDGFAWRGLRSLQRITWLCLLYFRIQYAELNHGAMCAASESQTQNTLMI